MDYSPSTPSTDQSPRKLPDRQRIISAMMTVGWDRKTAAMIADHMHAGTDRGIAGHVVRRFVDPTYRYRQTPVKQTIPPRLRTAVFERDAYRCQHCGDWHNLSVDHIHPESKGGTLDIDNLQTLCKSCNSRKGARL